MSSTSRVLQTGTNRITQNYSQHCAKCDANPPTGWARGTDVVKSPANLDNIIAHSDGTVIKVMTGQVNGKNDPEGFGYGNYVMILHNTSPVNNGYYVTLYAHLDSVATAIKPNIQVKKATVLGFMGNTGHSFGGHLHWECRFYNELPNSKNLHDTKVFKWLNPEPYLAADLPVAPPVNGFLDNATIKNNMLSTSGWAYQNGGSVTVTVKVYKGSTVVKTFSAVANSSRPDVKTVMGYTTDKVGFVKSVDISTLANGTYTVKAFVGGNTLFNTKTITIANPVISKGTKYILNNTPIYNDVNSTTSSGVRSGTFYTWEDESNNLNIRMTNQLSRVGVAGQVSFFCAKADLKKL